jgi:hypothetical protein
MIVTFQMLEHWSTALVIAVVQRTFASLLKRIHERRNS